MTTKEIVLIPTQNLYPHPDNPRKDVGDITELAESIKANGILQNLTVVPRMQGGYTVIIGHRRLAAAKKAGILSVPCVVASMTEEEQITTMLTENMQRTDLTIYEQAKSFEQLTLDMGMSVAEVSKLSGFSESTVKGRIKLAKLPEDDFKKAVDRGATLFDFAELDKIKDAKKRDEVLKKVGTANFRNELKYALDNQQKAEKLDKWHEQISKWATEVKDTKYEGQYKYANLNGRRIRLEYIRNYGYWTADCDAEKPDEETEYYFQRETSSISVYKVVSDDYVSEDERRRTEAIARSDAAAAKWNRMNEVMKRHKAMRQEFVLGYGSAKKSIGIILRYAAQAMIANAEIDADVDDLADMLAIRYDEELNELDRADIETQIDEQPERTLLVTTYWYMDSYGGYANRVWSSEQQKYLIVPKENEHLNLLYAFLAELGYEMSDEEVAMMFGTHELFDVPNEE